MDDAENQDREATTKRLAEVVCQLRQPGLSLPELDALQIEKETLLAKIMETAGLPAPTEDEARAIARKLEFHYTPKHGSWLNIAEIELAVLSNSCLSRRIPDETTLRLEVNANVRERNARASPVKWKFTAQEARRKLARLYPCVSQ